MNRYKSYSFILFFLCCIITSCGKKSNSLEPIVPPSSEVESSLSLREIAAEATVSVHANYDLKIKRSDYYLSPDGEITEYQSLLEPFSIRGTGVTFKDDSDKKIRIVTARHVVDAQPFDLLKNSPAAIETVVTLLVKEGFSFENLTEKEMLLAVENYANYILEPIPLSNAGHIVKANSSIQTYRDQVKRNPRLTPKVGYSYERDSWGELYDFAIVAPQTESVLDIKYAFHLDDLATSLEITKIVEEDKGTVYSTGLPSSNNFDFVLSPSEGMIDKFTSETVQLVLNNSRPGCSGAAVLSTEREKILGFIDEGDENNVFAVPAPAVHYKLKQAFGS
jgi:hypothetical protein